MRKMRLSSVLPLALLATAPASAEVLRAEPHALAIRQTIQLVVPPAEAMAAFTQVASWWSKDHSYSGDAANLSLDARPGGCFCERFADGGGIEHMRVTYVKPGEAMALTGALGPLLAQAVTGVMSVKAERIAGGSRVTIDYRATGFVEGDGSKFAPMVDAMLADQGRRFRAYATTAARRSSQP